MSKTNMRLLSIFGAAALVWVTVSPSALAQQASTRSQAAVATAPASERESLQTRRQAQAATARMAERDCGSDCADAPGAKLASPSDGGVTRYTCNGGNCACSGACQCVAMEDICMPNTMGCSDYGCTCKKAADAEPVEPNC